MKSMKFTGLLPLLALAASILVSACKKETAQLFIYKLLQKNNLTLILETKRKVLLLQTS